MKRNLATEITNNNENISKFIAELSPIIDLLQSENKYATVVGDFNINLLQINEREKISEFFDMICTNSFFPKITLPTRYCTHSCSLIDQMFCKVPHKQEIDISSSIIISRISDHFPCIVNLRTPGEGRKQEKLIYTRTINDSAINDFREELSRLDIPSRLNANLLSDPNIDYGKFEEVLCASFNKHFPEKRIKVNKCKHKLSPSITSGMIKSIEFRDNLYKKLKACTTDSPEYELNQYNLKIYNGYLRQCIRAAKKQHYTHEFAKYKNDIRKTWDTLKDIMNKKKSKVEFPTYLIINQSLCSGIFPSKLKIAKVIPLFKKGDIQLFGNYRPISLLSSVSKVFEKAACGQLYEYFSSHALFYDSQYGFRKYHSTELAALELVDLIHKEIDENKIPFSVFLDLSKAFDTLDHDILLHKLQYYGITGTALDWFRSYLTERYQYVDYNGASSSMKLLTTRVPQGSILGPLLLIIYMNDIHTVSNNLNFILYADDTTLTSPLCSFTYWGYHDINRVSTLINSEITKISEWLSVNKLSLNANKTKFMIFHNYQKVMTDSDIPQLEMNKTPIERVAEFNFLGITINEFMNWGSHSVKIANKICRTLG